MKVTREARRESGPFLISTSSADAASIFPNQNECTIPYRRDAIRESQCGATEKIRSIHPFR